MKISDYSPLYKKEASLEIHFISSLGIYITLIQVIAIIWGNETRVLREDIDVVYNLMDMTVTKVTGLGGCNKSYSHIVFLSLAKKNRERIKIYGAFRQPYSALVNGI